MLSASEAARAGAAKAANESILLGDAKTAAAASLGAGHVERWRACSPAQQVIVEASGAGGGETQQSGGPAGKVRTDSSPSSIATPLHGHRGHRRVGGCFALIS